MPKTVSKVEFTPERYRDLWALSCVYDGARYHVWIDKNTLQWQPDAKLYKNPLERPKGDTSPTVHCNLHSKRSQKILDGMFAAIKTLKLREAGEKKLAETIAKEEIDHAADVRKTAIHAAGPQFHEALRKIEAALRGANGFGEEFKKESIAEAYKISADALRLVPVQLTR